MTLKPEGKPRLVVTRGLPGSGKTTFAREWVAEDHANRSRVNRDDIRVLLHDGYQKINETKVTVARDALIGSLLRRGVSVVSDDTNLPNRTIRDLHRVAEQAEAEFEIKDMTNVSPGICIMRDRGRFNASGSIKGCVGEEVILNFYDRYVKGKPYPLPVDLNPGGNRGATSATSGEKYTPKPGTQLAIIIDIDGTVAHRGSRDPFDETRVHEDTPNPPVVHAIKKYLDTGYKPLFVSGRSAGCYTETLEWLQKHVLSGPLFERYPVLLMMRAEKDFRKDSVVKQEIFNQHIRDVYNVEVVFDDRDQVVKMWRDLGLTVFQVAEGNF